MIKSMLSFAMSILLANCLMGQDKLIFTGFGQGFIGTCDIDGSNYAEILSFSGGGSQGLKIDEMNQKIYWSNSGNVLSADYNSQVIDTIYASDNEVADIALNISGNKIYWSDTEEDKVFAADLQGNNIEEIYSAFSLNVLCLAYNPENNKLVFGRQNGTIGAISLIDNSIEALTEIEYVPTEIEIDTTADKIYFINQFVFGEEVSTIERCNYDGTGVETIIPGLGNPFGLALSDTNIYWTDWDSDFADIRRSDKQGENITDIFTSSSSSPYSLAIVSNLILSANEFIHREQVEVFPNPTTNTVFFKQTTDFDTVRLVDFQGNAINEYPANDGKISLGNLPAGIYILCFLQKDKLMGTTRIVKQ